MPCNCSGIRSRRCSCKVFGYPLKKSRSQNFMLVAQNDSICYFNPSADKLNYFCRLFEKLYDVCSGYNLRYCSLQVGLKRDQILKNAVKDFIILVCFLAANFVVFFYITVRMMMHVYLVFKESIMWIKRSWLEPESKESALFESHMESTNNHSVLTCITE